LITNIDLDEIKKIKVNPKVKKCIRKIENEKNWLLDEGRLRATNLAEPFMASHLLILSFRI